MGNRRHFTLTFVLLSASFAFAQSAPQTATTSTTTPQSTAALIQQASTQFRTAEKLEASLYEKPVAERTRAEYLKVINAYERVYLITPHTGWADNALTSVARLYEEIKDPKNAIKTLRFLVHEYPQTPLRDVAEKDIVRLSGMDEGPIKDPNTSVENIRYWEEEIGRAHV